MEGSSTAATTETVDIVAPTNRYDRRSSGSRSSWSSGKHFVLKFISNVEMIDEAKCSDAMIEQCENS